MTTCGVQTEHISQSYLIDSFVRGVDVIPAFGAEYSRLTVPEVAERIGMSRAM